MRTPVALLTRAGRIAAPALAALAAAAAAQQIDDIPPAVRNNVPPNFMFMIDNSGSMNNIVPAAPYRSTATYLAACPGGSTVPAGTSVDVRIVGGVPALRYGGTNYRHTSVAGSLPARCFSNAASYSARLLGDDTIGGGTRAPGGYLDSEYTGHFLNWYFGAYDGPASGWVDRKALASGGVQTRMEIARQSAKTVIDALPLPSAGGVAAVRVGLSTYRSGGGALLVPMGDLTSGTRATLRSQVDALTPSGATPLASTFADIGRYMATGYTGTVTTAIHAGVDLDALLRLNGTDNSSRAACLAGAPSCTSSSSPRPIQQWCQRSSLFAMTDGRPQGDRSFNNNSYLRDYDRDCSGSNAASCVGGGAAGSWDRKTARSYESQGSDYMDDVAKALFDTDLRPDLTKPVRVPPAKNNISTYMIGFADPAVQNDPLLINTAAQGGGRFIAATDGPSLVEAFQSVITEAMARDASAAAVSVTSAVISAGTVGYASSYNSGSWYGDLEAYSLDPSTGLQTGPVQWSARDKLNAQTAASRKIVSFNGTAGVPFTAANGPSFRTATPGLTDALINYTRGDRTGEGTTFRARTYLLGDIVNAEPVVVNYPGGVVVFQAANDGMLHAFDGRVEAAAASRGQELWAYVPQLVHGKLAARASPVFEHEYLVDGTPAVAEIGLGPVGRILVGGLNKGGAGYYALNITSGPAASEAALAGKVLWEFRPASMGYSFGTPLIVRTAAGWRVVVASGYRNDAAAGGLGGDGRGHVWVLDPATGAVEKEFVTPAGFGSAAASLGLAHLGRLANAAPDAVVRHVYAGDLQGNLWRFDLDAPHGSAPVRIAVLTAPDGSTQPVTSPPVIARAAAGSATQLFVYLGTGQYLSSDDVPGTATPNRFASQVETLYGIIDDTATGAPALPNIRGSNGGSCPAGGGNGDLVCQSASQASAGAPFTATHHPVDPGSRRGFYLDIPVPAGRVNTQPALTVRGTLVFVVNQPTNVVCNPGGTSYLFQLDAATGGAVARLRGGSTYFDAGELIAQALSSRPVLITTSGGIRALERLSDRTTESREIHETAVSVSPFRRIYKRSLD